MKVNFELPKFHVLDDLGNPLSGGKVYFYEAGTTTLKDTYADAEGTTKNSNPVILDSRGEADIFLDRDPYKIMVYTATNTLVFSRDNYQGFMAADDNQAEDLLINPDARVNQINYVSGDPLAVDDYLYDMWKCSAAGSVTFTAGGSITLAAGTKIKQKNDDLMGMGGVEVTAFVESGQVTVNGLGLASATVISPGTPVTWTIDTATSEWFEIGSANAETFSGLHIVKGAAAVNVRERSIIEEQQHCYRYLFVLEPSEPVGFFHNYYSTGLISGESWCICHLPVPMRKVPSINTDAVIKPVYSTTAGSIDNPVIRTTETMGFVANAPVSTNKTVVIYDNDTGGPGGQIIDYGVVDPSGVAIVIDARY